MSCLVTLPSFPVPEMVSSSEADIPSCLAMFLTSGEKNFPEEEVFPAEADSSTGTGICSPFLEGEISTGLIAIGSMEGEEETTAEDEDEITAMAFPTCTTSPSLKSFFVSVDRKS